MNDRPPTTKDVVAWVTVDNIEMLREADLTGIDLSKQDFWGADLHGLNLRRCCFIESNLFGADMHDADVRDCDFHHANLDRVNFRGARYNKNTFIPDIYDPGRLGMVRDEDP